ncbi:MAG: hypothetical protein WB347_03795, partial [Terriglobales bacterium]
MGYSSLSGPVRTKVAALRKYGLLEQQGGQYKLSDLAIHVLHDEADSEQRKQALSNAALRPELFRELFATHAEASDNALKSHLMVHKKFSDAGAKQFIKAFRETLSLANPSKTDYDDSQDEDNPEAMESTPTAGTKLSTIPVQRPTQNTFVVPLSKDMSAQVTFSGGAVKGSHMETLTKYLNLAKLALEAEEEE